jgi:hypothetical protein
LEESPATRAGPSNRSGKKEDQHMIQLLIEVVLSIGRFTVLIRLPRKRKR